MPGPECTHPLSLPLARRLVLAGAVLLSVAPFLYAGGPRAIAGVSSFDPAVVGHPVVWPNGQVRYYVDQGPLSASISNRQAVAMVDAAAALWNAIPTAAIALADSGPLNEDVSGVNILADSAGKITAPSDVTSSATAYPVAVIFDQDGAVIDALFGATASQPTSCQDNAAFVWADNITPEATYAHAVILLNGRCADAEGMDRMQFEVERAFGQVLGLDFSQVNPGADRNGEPGGTDGWPVMQPLSGLCGSSGGVCISTPSALRFDDVAAASRLYPVTAANQAGFPGKQITAANTISIQGTVSFVSGYGMQGVNVVARPLDAKGAPLYQYTVTAVSGALFSGKHGNPVTGWNDSSGNPLSMWGSADPAQQGFFDLSGIPLPPGMNSADYQISFEPIGPLYTLGDSVGPYSDGQVAPSGTLAPVTLRGLSAGAAQTLTIVASDSARGGSDAIGAESQPRPLPASGFWSGRLGQVGQADWFTFPVRGHRLFTLVTQALDESGAPSNAKVMPAIGVWDAFAPAGNAPARATAAFNVQAAGATSLRVMTNGAVFVRAGIADQRGDGRPDYAYNGWVLYADSVEPARLPASGGAIVIRGMGFRPGDTVSIGGKPALVTSISPNEITAVAPAAASNVTGPVDVEVDDRPEYFAATIISGSLNYDAASGDALALITAPMNTVPIGVPLPFTVSARDLHLAPAGGVTVTYKVASGTATLGCGAAVCSVAASGDGRATIAVTAVDATASVVTASLTNGSSVQAHFAGGTPPVLAALTPSLSIAAGVTVQWPVQALALNNGVPAPGQAVIFQSGSGIAVQGDATATTDANGVATLTLTVGPLSEGQTASIQACLNGGSQCVRFSALGARTEYARLMPVSGTAQTVAGSGTPTQIVLRLLDSSGNPMAGGSVNFYQALYEWTPPCAAHTTCTLGALLATETGTARSAIDGTVLFTPASLPGVATRLYGLAAAGASATVPVAVEQH
ncbi:MAG: IPT/TIG domain-containing protein [Acidobacteriota bacterium]